MEGNKYLIDYYNQDFEDERLLSKQGSVEITVKVTFK